MNKPIMKTAKKAVPAPKKAKLQKYSVERLVSFYEVHIVQAKSVQEAEVIAENSDPNLSKHIGNKVINTRICKDEDYERFKSMDKYFFKGSCKVDAEGNLMYLDELNKHNKSMPTEKIFEKA